MSSLHEKYNAWCAGYQSFKAMIESRAIESVWAIEHIGSTSVPELKSKDIVDVQLGVANMSNIGTLKAILVSLGFEYIDSFKQDHLPFRIPEVMVEGWEKRFFRGCFEGQNFNLHVRVKGASNWQYAIDFRDYLIKQPQARIAYQQVKERLMKAKVSREDYTSIKDPVCDLIYLLFEQANKNG